jgi:putative tryptophan/tyrosine transport system substrate-binding protein
MRRREFIAGLLLATTPSRTQAQQPGKVYRIAIIHPSASAADMSETGQNPNLSAFFIELRRLGYVEGQNLVVERYSSEGRPEGWPERAREAVRSNPDLIFAVSIRIVQHLKDATTVIPIVGVTADPVAAGLVTSLARPTGNLTGVIIDAGYEIWDKRLQILREAVPAVSRVGLLAPRNIWERHYGSALRELAERAGIALLGPPLNEPIQEAEYHRVFQAMARDRADALMVNEVPENFAHMRVVVGLAAQARLPTIYPWRDAVEVGGLMAYSPDFVDLFHNAARQVSHLLKGAKPGEIPFYQPTKFALILNLKTARALGITIPASLLAHADEVIE